MTKNYMAQNVSSAKGEKLCPVDPLLPFCKEAGSMGNLNGLSG